MSLSGRAVCSLRIALISLLLLLLPFCSSAKTELSPVTSGRYTVAWTPANGLSVAVDGVTVVRQSTFYLVKAGWKGVLLDQREIVPTITDWNADGAGATTATATLENDNALCKYTFTLTRQGKKDVLDVALAYRLKRDIPAEIEYAAGYLSGPVVAGATFTGTLSGTQLPLREIAIAPPPVTNTQEQNRLCPAFDTITLATRLGQLQIDSTGPYHPVIFDARSDSQDWASAFPVFWMGIGSPSQPVRFSDGEKVTRFRWTLSPASAAPKVQSDNTLPSINRTAIEPEMFVPPAQKTPLVIPTPKFMSFANGNTFRLNAATKLVACDESAGTKRAITLLQQAIKEQFALNLPIVKQARSNALYIGLSGKSPALSMVSVPQKPEGYGIHFPAIAGHDEAGVLWGVQTTIQLLSVDAKGVYLPSVTISDWPTLALRGVHLFHGQNALPFHKKLIDRIFSRYKLNTLLIQAEQVRWQNDPAVAPTWAGTPEQIPEEVAFARAHGITVYPLVQSYGHMEWLFNKPQIRDFAEDPALPYAVNFTNPAAVKYLEGFDGEADQTFNAPAFHIGLDEVTMRGKFPARSAPRTFSDLFVTAATHWHDFFAKRGKQTWMWADMALNSSEIAPCYGGAPSVVDAEKVRAGLPKDIVMFDWQYSPHDRYPSLKKLKDAGFKKIVAATWYNPTGIQNFARAAASIGAWGGLQTTWCGYESSEAVLDTNERRQFVAMILAAEYFWNGGQGPTPDKLPYNADEVFAKQWRGVVPDFRSRSGWGLRLAPAGNRPLNDFIGNGFQNRLINLHSGLTHLVDGTLYDISERPIVLFGKLNPVGDYPLEVTLPSRSATVAPAHVARLLIAASHRMESGINLGKIVVTCTDGTSFDVPIVYGKNIAAWDDNSGLADAPILLRDRTPSGQDGILRQLEIVAPAGKEMDSLKVVSEGRESAPIIFGVTFLE